MAWTIAMGIIYLTKWFIAIGIAYALNLYAEYSFRASRRRCFKISLLVWFVLMLQLTWIGQYIVFGVTCNHGFRFLRKI